MLTKKQRWHLVVIFALSCALAYFVGILMTTYDLRNEGWGLWVRWGSIALIMLGIPLLNYLRIRSRRR